MKSKIKYFLQRALGFQRYLFTFSLYKIATLKWDRKEGDFFHFMKLLKGEGDILDVGANIGIMTAHLGKQFNNKTIYAIEPMPENLNVLRKIIARKRLRNVEIMPWAVGSKLGKLKMVMPVDGKAKLQGLSHVLTPEITEWNEGIEVEVDVKTLDDLFLDKQIVGIKMDVENYEFHALKGAEQLLSTVRPIVYTELWDNENRNQCFAFMRSLGYKIEVLVNGELQTFNPDLHTHQNFFFLPN